LNLAFDIGNTRIKAGVFDGEVLVESKVFDLLGDDRISDFARANDVQNVIFCSVNDDKFDIGSVIAEVPGMVIELTDQTMLPIVNSYHTPGTLGKDRLAAAVGAYRLFPDSNVLIIDAGTCITYDLVTVEAEFVGGNIAPGLDMRLTAMHDYTSRLPLVRRGVGSGFMGKSTEEALKNGAVQGILLEIDGYIKRLKGKYGTLETMLTGGDGRYFADLMKTKIFVRSNLVLIGLNEILKVNVAELN
jgi:type III pantothenate kinase